MNTDANTTCGKFDTAWTNEPTCPYCGQRECDAWQIDFDGIEGDVVHTCGSCDEEYQLARNAIITYTSERMKRPAETAPEPEPVDAALNGGW
ncbi:MAG: hypothetical protein ABW154_07755 [Dyella sp.]